MPFPISSLAGTTTAVPHPLTFLERLLSRSTGRLLFRDATASSFAFSLGLCLMWALVDLLSLDRVAAAAISFVAANALHYLFAQTWIYHGTRRPWREGYGYFLVTAGAGLPLTIVLFAALVRWTPMHYLVARTLVSVFSGLMMFILNASLNFKKV